MKRLNQLIGNVGEITLGGGGRGDLFPYLREFFSRDEVKRRLVEMNQHQLFDLQKDKDGRTIGTYTHRVSLRKARHGLPSGDYTFYETGEFFRSMDVVANDVEVEIVTDGGMGIDSIGRSVSHRQSPNHIGWMMNRYNPTHSSLGLQDDGMEAVMDETDIVEGMRDIILDHLNNG